MDQGHQLVRRSPFQKGVEMREFYDFVLRLEGMGIEVDSLSISPGRSEVQKRPYGLVLLLLRKFRVGQQGVQESFQFGTGVSGQNGTLRRQKLLLENGPLIVCAC